MSLSPLVSFRHIVFFAGKMIFQREPGIIGLLHNETPLGIEKRLRWLGIPW
jgi:hypothetical protein